MKNKVNNQVVKDDTVAVVVHYRNHGVIGETLRSLVQQGLAPNRILVVDTSEAPEQEAELRGSIPRGTKCIFIKNRGYGAAVNAGVQHWSETVVKPSYVLVATHEVRWMPHALDLLKLALQDAPDAAAAGPTLITGDEPYSVWSEGGFLTPTLGLPRHYNHKTPFEPDEPKSTMPAERAWLDGSCVLYNLAALAENPIDETYFLYMEETDLHLRLKKLGRTILWVPNSVAWQSSLGIPSKYATRNLRLLYRRSGRPWLGKVAVPLDLARQIASSIKKRGRLRQNLPSLLTGLFSRLPQETKLRTLRVQIINPLGVALAHYTDELVSVLKATGAASHLRSFPEPSASGRGRISWIMTYCRELTAARKLSKNSNMVLIVTWPVLGHLDKILISLFYRRPAWLVIHDPRPLVRAVGYGKASLWLGNFIAGKTSLIAHSKAAFSEMVLQGSREVTLLPHPILATAETDRDSLSGFVERVLVLGQYKIDRDISLLEALSQRLSGKYSLEIYGRGWPAVSGWSVTPGFMTEQAMDERIATASVILIPYSRFYQSGIAVRALELGTPVVGPRASSLAELLGLDSGLLVDRDGIDPEDSWTEAIKFDVNDGASVIPLIANRFRQSTVKSWHGWVASVMRNPETHSRGCECRATRRASSRQQICVTRLANDRIGGRSC